MEVEELSVEVHSAQQPSVVEVHSDSAAVEPLAFPVQEQLQPSEELQLRLSLQVPQLSVEEQPADQEASVLREVCLA